MRLVRALDRHHRVTVVPFQKPGVPEANGLTFQQCEQAAWAVTPDGMAYRAAAAINLTLAVALGTSWPLWLYSIPGCTWTEERWYRWIAANRGRFPGDTPYCEQFPEECGVLPS